MTYGETLESRVARLEEAWIHHKEDRIESRADRKEIIHRLDALTQASQSTNNAIANLSLEKCGERLTSAELRLAELERHTEPLPKILPDLLFWQRVLGGGIWSVAKVFGFLASAGVFSIIANEWWHDRL